MLPSDRVRSVLVKRSGKTDPAYGTPPVQRSLEAHLRLGAINLDKTSGPTSHEVAAWVKRILEVEKAGHSGTLDPKVTGILPVLLGDATRVMDTLLLAGKEYICLMHVHKPQPKKRILEVCQEFTGPIFQKPPLKSSVVKELRIRTIYYLEVLEIEEQLCAHARGLPGGHLHSQAVLRYRSGSRHGREYGGAAQDARPAPSGRMRRWSRCISSRMLM